MNLALEYFFCESCGAGYILKPGRKMRTCWFCGTAVEKLSDAAELEYNIVAYAPEPKDIEDEPDGGDGDPSFTIPPD